MHIISESILYSFNSSAVHQFNAIKVKTQLLWNFLRGGGGKEGAGVGGIANIYDTNIYIFSFSLTDLINSVIQEQTYKVLYVFLLFGVCWANVGTTLIKCLTLWICSLSYWSGVPWILSATKTWPQHLVFTPIKYMTYQPYPKKYPVYQPYPKNYIWRY